MVPSVWLDEPDDSWRAAQESQLVPWHVYVTASCTVDIDSGMGHQDEWSGVNVLHRRSFSSSCPPFNFRFVQMSCAPCGCHPWNTRRSPAAVPLGARALHRLFENCGMRSKCEIYHCRRPCGPHSLQVVFDSIGTAEASQVVATLTSGRWCNHRPHDVLGFHQLATSFSALWNCRRPHGVR